MSDGCTQQTAAILVCSCNCNCKFIHILKFEEFCRNIKINQIQNLSLISKFKLGILSSEIKLYIIIGFIGHWTVRCVKNFSLVNSLDKVKCLYYLTSIIKLLCVFTDLKGKGWVNSGGLGLGSCEGTGRLLILMNFLNFLNSTFQFLLKRYTLSHGKGKVNGGELENWTRGAHCYCDMELYIDLIKSSLEIENCKTEILGHA